ncbi:MAG TPA: hypothetical protein VGK02_10850 [Candidatus Aquicultor sp.]|jgi:hypothetical protein
MKIEEDSHNITISNPPLPIELGGFERDFFEPYIQRKPIKHHERLLQAELADVKQQIRMRWVLAFFFGALLIAQHAGLFLILKWTLEKGILPQLQTVFAILIPATLAQTYGIASLIVDRMFKSIDYTDKQDRFNDHDDK